MLLSAGRHAILVACPMGWQQDGAHPTAHRSSDRSLSAQLASTPDRRPVRGYPAGPSARWPARRVHQRSSRRPTRCIAIRCRPHRERAHLPHLVCFAASRGRERAQCLGMMNLTEPPSGPFGGLVPFTGQLPLAVAACLASFNGCSYEHAESDLRCYLAWCAERGLDLPARLTAVGTAVLGAPVMPYRASRPMMAAP